MGLIRCTCIYRAATPAERVLGAPAVVVQVVDPLCPATELHGRVRRRRRTSS